MKPELSIPRMSRSEQETQTEANRLIELIKGALAVVSIRSTDEIDSLELTADRLERAARDLAFALRELARERRLALEETE